MKQVLIADDSRTSRKSMMSLLQALHPDWSYHQAVDGEQACQLVAGQPFDLVILDINMPKMDGLTAADYIRRLLPDACLCMVTADIQPQMQLKAQRLGVRFIRKPVSEAMIEQIVQLLEP